MSDFHDNEKNFMDGVWKKTRYLEYIRAEQEKEKRELIILKKKKFKSLLTFVLGLIFIAIPLLVTGDFSEGLAALLGIYMMSFALYYEYNFN